MGNDSLTYDCAVAAAMLIVALVRDDPEATDDEMLDFMTAAIHAAIEECERRKRDAEQVARN